MGILEEYGVSVHGFDGLRSDAYEKQIAGRSLADLETFYGLLLGAGRSYKELAPECPKWGKEPKPPHWTTLQGIKERIRMEGRLADMSGHLKAFQAGAGGVVDGVAGGREQAVNFAGDAGVDRAGVDGADDRRREGAGSSAGGGPGDPGGERAGAGGEYGGEGEAGHGTFAVAGEGAPNSNDE